MKAANYLKRFGQIILVNLLWIVFSLPLITAGAATCAAYYVMLKLVDNEECNIPKMFVKGFKDNFLQGTVMWIISVVTIGAAVFFWYKIIDSGDASFVVKAGAFIYSFIIYVLNIFIYPILARYKNTLKNSIKNAFAIAIQYLYSTIMICVFVGIELFLISLNFYTRIIGLVIGVGIIIFTISSIVKKTFKAIEQIK